jgi:hypothetical protein
MLRRLTICLLIPLMFYSCNKSKVETNSQEESFTKENLLLGSYIGTYNYCGSVLCQMDTVNFTISRAANDSIYLQMKSFNENIHIDNPQSIVYASFKKFEFLGNKTFSAGDSSTFSYRLFGEYNQDSVLVVFSEQVTGADIYKNELRGKRL